MNIKIQHKNINQCSDKNNLQKIPEDYLDLDGKLCNDINGNVYLVVNIVNSKIYYSLNIDKNNDIEFYKIDESKLKNLNNPDNIEYDTIIETEFTSLKKKTLDSIENDIESDHEEEFKNYQQKIKYLNEDKYYCTEYKQLSDSDCDNEKFIFSKKVNKESLNLINKGIDIFAIYDTYIRDQHKNVIASIVFTGENSYRISFFPDLSIELNIIGDQIRTYNLCYIYEDEQKLNNKDIIILCNKINQKNNS